MKVLFRYENIIMVLSFAIITFFSLLLINQIIMSEKSGREYNNFNGKDSAQISIKSTSGNFSFDYTGLAENYVIYNRLDMYSEKSYSMTAVRAVYGEGSFPIPEMRSGSYFTAEQLVSEERLCIVGRVVYERDLVEKDGKKYFEHDNLTYEVIGIMGTSEATDLDIMVFLNAGGYYGSSGVYFSTYLIDSFNADEITQAYENLTGRLDSIAESGMNASYSRIAFTQKIRSIDTITSCLYNTALLLLVITLMITSVSFSRKNVHQFAVKKLIGYSKFIISLEITLRFISIAVIGMIIGLISIAIFSNMEFFKADEMSYFLVISPMTVLAVFGVVLASSTIISIIPAIAVYKADTSSLLK